MRLALALAAALLPALAAARPALSLRLAYAPAFGSAASELPMGDVVEAQVPVQLDALWRFGRASAGAYASFGLARAGASTCEGDASCDASVLRAGIEGLWALPVLRPRLLPWAGAGLGLEWARHRRERLGVELDCTWRGVEANVQGGLDWSLGERFALGGYALLAAGRYTGTSLDTSAASVSTAVLERAVHVWIHLGVRGTVNL